MTTLKVEDVYPMGFETDYNVAQHLPRFIDSYDERRLHFALEYLSPNRFEKEQARILRPASDCLLPATKSTIAMCSSETFVI